MNGEWKEPRFYRWYITLPTDKDVYDVWFREEKPSYWADNWKPSIPQSWAQEHQLGLIEFMVKELRFKIDRDIINVRQSLIKMLKRLDRI